MKPTVSYLMKNWRLSMIKHARLTKQHKNFIKKDNNTSLRTIIELNTTNSTKEPTNKWANMKDTWWKKSFQT